MLLSCIVRRRARDNQTPESPLAAVAPATLSEAAPAHTENPCILDPASPDEGAVGIVPLTHAKYTGAGYSDKGGMDDLDDEKAAGLEGYSAPSEASPYEEFRAGGGCGLGVLADGSSNQGYSHEENDTPAAAAAAESTYVNVAATGYGGARPKALTS